METLKILDFIVDLCTKNGEIRKFFLNEFLFIALSKARKWITICMLSSPFQILGGHQWFTFPYRCLQSARWVERDKRIPGRQEDSEASINLSERVAVVCTFAVEIRSKYIDFTKPDN